MKDISTMVDIMEVEPEYTPVPVRASNGRLIPLEMPIQGEEDHMSSDELGECIYPLACCANWRRPCNRCPHLERFWP